MLAAWLTDPKNPLTARVMVNRIWHYHFGRGIVAHAGRFRSMGERADASRAARLAGQRVRRERLEHEGDAPADHAVEHLSAVVGSRRKPRRRSIPDKTALALPAAAPGSGSDSRFRAWRSSGLLNTKMGGPSVVPGAAGRGWQPRRLEGERRTRRTAEPAQRLHLCPPQPPVSDAAGVRYAGHARERAAPGDDDGAPGTHAAE